MRDIYYAVILYVRYRKQQFRMPSNRTAETEWKSLSHVSGFPPRASAEPTGATAAQ